MQINDDGVALIKRWEGLRLEAYQDIGGVWTIGYGHTATAKPGMKITEEEAERLLRQDLLSFEAAVRDTVRVELTENQFSALVSFAYNVGGCAFKRSTLVKKLNAGQHDAVPGELARWNKVKGKPVAGLSNRRAAEAGLWARGAHVASRDVNPDNPSPAAAKAAVGTAVVGVVTTIAQSPGLITAFGALGQTTSLALIGVSVIMFIMVRKGWV